MPRRKAVLKEVFNDQPALAHEVENIPDYLVAKEKLHDYAEEMKKIEEKNIEDDVQYRLKGFEKRVLYHLHHTGETDMTLTSGNKNDKRTMEIFNRVASLLRGKGYTVEIDMTEFSNTANLNI